ncbi:MAG TPA: HAD hydrolase-like protein [Polyangiales bacterium]
MTKLLLFDIDGTLLRAYGAGSRAMMHAALEVLGERCLGAKINLGGALDPWIFRELARHGGYEAHDAAHRAFRERYAQRLAHELDMADVPCRAMPGVLELLASLREQRSATLGMLTGNYPETGRHKLRRAGIDPEWFSPIAWGDAAADRPALVRVALAASKQHTAADVIVIGDTPRDVHCARENGAVCLAVATGDHGEDELRAAGAHEVVPDLRDPSALYRLLSR